ncbi:MULTISPECIES: hypothetical protein [Staphylococcus]|uniref:hypothetical protein n=1 Tax=Staphylococcus sp. GDH8C109P TaxID=2804088 RepID=UPI001AEC69FB|nr:hypothetical protein [Staphylococcus sp. GDH8C109P]
MENLKLDFNKLKFLAEDKNKELIELHKHGRFFKTVARDAGYVPEYALKAVVCKYHFGVYPDHLKGYKTHKLDVLLKKANLTNEFKNEQRGNPKFKASWSSISNWTSELRYNTEITKQHASRYMNALNNENGGVYKWIKKHW